MAITYELVTGQILRLLERGVAPWRQPWNSAAEMPRNLISGRRYRGINALLLHAARVERGYRTPWWATFNQVRGLRGKVRKGERATKIVYWQSGGSPEGAPEAAANQPSWPVLRYFNVFNLDQCDRLGAKVPAAGPPTVVEPLAAAERIVTAMPNAPAIHRGELAACYRPGDDAIRLPSPRAFQSPAAYYATLFHELAHATGHPTRLGRFAVDMEVPPFGSPDYSQEELTAEMTAAFLCAEAGISAATVEQAASYIESWLRVLKSNPQTVIVAGGRAQKAADHILGREVSEHASSNSPRSVPRTTTGPRHSAPGLHRLQLDYAPPGNYIGQQPY